MLRKSLALFFVLLLSVGAATAQEPEKWGLLGSLSSDGLADEVSIDTTAARGAYRAVRLVVKGASVSIGRVVVAYSDGRSLEERRAFKLEAGERTRSIAPLEEDRFIDRVDVAFDERPAATSTVIEVWGLQTASGVAMARRADAGTGEPGQITRPDLSGIDFSREVRQAVLEASNRARTVVLGEHTALPGAPGNATLDNKARSTVASLQVRVADAPLFIEDLTIYRQGAAVETIKVDAEIKAGKQSDWLKLQKPGEITSVAMNYRPPASGARSRVSIVSELASDANLRLASTPLDDFSKIYKQADMSAAQDCIEANTCTPVNIHFGTNRKREDKPELIGFGPDRDPDSKLWLGRATVTVPKGHKPGQFERPGFWRSIPLLQWFGVWKQRPDKHIVIPEHGISVFSSEEDFIRSMRAALEEQQSLEDNEGLKGHAFVFVHGYRVTFENALYRTAQIAYDLGSGPPSEKTPYGVPFMFSWPARGETDAYMTDGDNARLAAGKFSEFLKLVVEKSGARRVHLIAHSMGNEALLAVLRELTREGRDRKIFDQLVLAAPDVWRDTFTEEMLPLARKVASAVTLYASSNDAAIIASRRFHSGQPRAGDVPPGLGPVMTPVPSPTAGTEFEREPRFYPIDVSLVSTGVFSFEAHNNYAGSRELLSDMGELLREGRQPPDKRTFSIFDRLSPDRRWRYWVHPGK